MLELITCGAMWGESKLAKMACSGSLTPHFVNNDYKSWDLLKHCACTSQGTCLLMSCCQVESVVSDSVRPHGLKPTRLLCPWDSPGKNTGVSCHFLLQCLKVKSESEVAQSCLTLSDPMDCSLPGSSIHGVFQARVLEWGAIAFSDAYISSA